MDQRSGVAVSCGVGCRRGLDLKLLWLWRRPVAMALIQPLAWEPPYAAGAAQEIATTTTPTTTKKDKKKKNTFIINKNTEVKILSPAKSSFFHSSLSSRLLS